MTTTAKPVAVIHYDNHLNATRPQVLVTAAVDGVACYLVRTPVDSQADVLGALVDAVRQVWRRQRGGMILYVGHPLIREWLSSMPEAYPGLELRSVVTGEALLRTWNACRRAHSLNAGVAPASELVHEPVERTEHLVIATDASKQHHDRTVGIAMVTSAGAVKMDRVAAKTILDGEFAAIGLAANHARSCRTVRSVDVLTDSLIVARQLSTGVRAADRNFGEYEIKCGISLDRARAAGIEVRVHWVRGHDGHPLNELADRAAVASRRCAQWGQSPAQFAVSIRGELGELLAAADPRTFTKASVAAV